MENRRWESYHKFKGRATQHWVTRDSVSNKGKRKDWESKAFLWLLHVLMLLAGTHTPTHTHRKTHTGTHVNIYSSGLHVHVTCTHILKYFLIKQVNTLKGGHVPFSQVSYKYMIPATASDRITRSLYFRSQFQSWKYLLGLSLRLDHMFCSVKPFFTWSPSFSVISGFWKLNLGTREMAQWSRVLVALPQDSREVLSIHIGWVKTTCHSITTGPKTLLGLYRHCNTH